MKRPVGVILTCVILGLLGTVQVLSGVFVLFLAVFMHNGIPAPATSSVPPPPAGLVSGILIVMALIILILGAWVIGTLVGLAKLRNWARYSVMVLGGLMTVFSIFAILGTIVVAAASAKGPPVPGIPAHTMQVVLAIYVFLYILLIAIGVWWLIYFNRRSTKAYFLPNYATQPALYPPPYPGTVALGSGPYPPPYPAPPPPPPSAFAEHLSSVPLPITIMACFFLLGAPLCLLITLMPLPAFLFGFLIPRPESIFLYLAFAALSGAVGVGLLRLYNWARQLCYAYMVIGLINFLVLITPWGQHRYALYNQMITASMNSGARPAPSPINGPAFMIGILLFCIVFYGIQVWILERYRYAFLKQTPPPPDPLKTPLML